MSALSNANTRRGGQKPPHIGFASNVIPEAKGFPTGVSVEYVSDPAKQWFVLRVSYGRAMKAAQLLANRQIAHYLPIHRVMKLINNRRRKVTEPLLPGFIFAYAEAKQVQELLDQYNSNGLLSYYYNHFHTDSFGKNPPLTITEESMRNFIRATSVAQEDIRVISRQYCHFKSGDRVRVTGGEFKGVEGRVARAAGQQRVIVELEGLCLVATAYIPSGLLSVIPKSP